MAERFFDRLVLQHNRRQNKYFQWPVDSTQIKCQRVGSNIQLIVKLFLWSKTPNFMCKICDPEMRISNLWLCRTTLTTAPRRSIFFNTCRHDPSIWCGNAPSRYHFSVVIFDEFSFREMII